MFNHIVCRYNEIATKSGNRAMFEHRLIDNMRMLCLPTGIKLHFARMRGRILIYREDNPEFTMEEQNALIPCLKKCFGLDSFSFCLEGTPDMKSVIGMIEKTVPTIFEPYLKQGFPVTFRTRARRSDKAFPLTSKEIEIEAATKIEELIGEGNVKVNLTNAQITLGIEVRDKNSILFFDSIKAAGGLPVGSNASMLALLSGGIDSPVASHMAMRRGCHVDYLTFHSYPYTPTGTVDKVRRIAAVLNKWQNPGTLYACNIANIQKLIRDNCDPRYRTILYRRVMMRIASMICRKNKLSAIVTGESVGQVASQTVENLSVIEKSSDYMIIRPLCALDKNEIIKRAENLETFNISIESMPDSCTVFAPASPVLHSKLHTVEYEEAKIPNLQEALEETFNSMESYVE